MSTLVLVGLNHTTARVDLRQKASFGATQLPEGLKRLSALPGVRESMIVSTCNRVEVLSCVEHQGAGIEAVEAFLSDTSRVPLEQLQDKLYRYADEQAVRHVFRVASSLDSMILGEPQILGQIKSCFTAASEARTVGAYLTRLLPATFRAAKRVRSETSIGEYPVSVSSAAVELTRKIFGDLRETSILIVGAGKMGEAAIRHLAETGARSVYVANRSPETAEKLAARFRGMAVPYGALHHWMQRADIVITSTGAPDILIEYPAVERIMQERKNAPIVFIDISVPRNVDPAVGTLDNVFCYDIDDLGAVVEANLQERIKAADAAEKIIDQEVQAFLAKLKSRDLGPAVVQIQGRIEEICRAEMQRYVHKVGPQEPRQVAELERMIARIAAKIAHPLVVQLRDSRSDSGEPAYADLIRRLLKTKDAE